MIRGSQEYEDMIRDWWNNIPEDAMRYIISGRVQGRSFDDIKDADYVYDDLCSLFEHCLNYPVSYPGAKKSRSD